MKNFVFAVATLVGAIVGLGMFGIPYAVSKTGFFVGMAYLVVLGGVMMLVHLVIGEIVERTKSRHRLTGYIEKYLGASAKKAVGGIIVFALLAALLAYIIVAGKFLALVLPDGASPFVLSLFFWGFMSIAVLRGIKTIGAIELLMTALLVLLIGILFLLGADKIDPKNFSGFHMSDFFLPYGVIIFALDGSVAIPEIREILKLEGKMYKRAIILGSFIPICIYVVFTALVLGVSGSSASEEALQGLANSLGPTITLFGAIFGLLAIATSYLVLGSNLKHTLEYDWKVSKTISRLLVAAAPIIIFIFGIHTFIEIIAFSGAVFGAIIFIFTLLVYQKAQKHGDKKPGYALRLPRFAVWALIALFVLGGVYEIIRVATYL